MQVSFLFKETEVKVFLTEIILVFLLCISCATEVNNFGKSSFPLFFANAHCSAAVVALKPSETHVVRHIDAGQTDLLLFMHKGPWEKKSKLLNVPMMSALLSLHPQNTTLHNWWLREQKGIFSCRLES